jgi:hypothetical protein
MPDQFAMWVARELDLSGYQLVVGGACFLGAAKLVVGPS